MILGIIVILLAVFIEMPQWLMVFAIIGASIHIALRIATIIIRGLAN